MYNSFFWAKQKVNRETPKPENQSLVFPECADAFWESLNESDKLNAFYAVISRMYKAECQDKGSYRYALYDVFGFSCQAYAIGMECHYFDMHNLLYDAMKQYEQTDTDEKPGCDDSEEASV